MPSDHTAELNSLFPEREHNSRRGFLVTKYSQAGMEWSLLDRVILDEERLGLRWGGCGIVAGSEPEQELAESNAKLVPMRDALQS